MFSLSLRSSFSFSFFQNATEEESKGGKKERKKVKTKNRKEEEKEQQQEKEEDVIVGNRLGFADLCIYQHIKYIIVPKDNLSFLSFIKVVFIKWNEEEEE